MDRQGAGHEQGVDAVLDGCIQREADRLRLTGQLIPVRDGEQVWAESFDKEFTNIFALEDALSERVAQSIRLKLTGEETRRLTKRAMEKPDAYEVYIKGHYFWNKRTDKGMKKAWNTSARQLLSTQRLRKPMWRCRFLCHPWTLCSDPAQRGVSSRQAISELQQAVTLSGGDACCKGSIGHAYAISGKSDHAHQVLQDLEGRTGEAYVRSYAIALVYAGLGDDDHAITWMQKAYEDRSTSIAFLKLDPELTSLHSDPRFEQLSQRVNF